MSTAAATPTNATKATRRRRRNIFVVVGENSSPPAAASITASASGGKITGAPAGACGSPRWVSSIGVTCRGTATGSARPGSMAVRLVTAWPPVRFGATAWSVVAGFRASAVVVSRLADLPVLVMVMVVSTPVDLDVGAAVGAIGARGALGEASRLDGALLKAAGSLVRDGVAAFSRPVSLLVDGFTACAFTACAFTACAFTACAFTACAFAAEGFAAGGFVAVGAVPVAFVGLVPDFAASGPVVAFWDSGLTGCGLAGAALAGAALAGAALAGAALAGAALAGAALAASRRRSALISDFGASGAAAILLAAGRTEAAGPPFVWLGVVLAVPGPAGALGDAVVFAVFRVGVDVASDGLEAVCFAARAAVGLALAGAAALGLLFAWLDAVSGPFPAAVFA
jgi:hypothetical protein